MIREFKKFVLRGNIIELLIGFTVGASFSSVVQSLVNDIIMPPIGLLLGRTDFSNLFITLKPGATSGSYHTVVQAQQAGAVTLNYGIFFTRLISLLIIGLVVFFLIRLINQFNEQGANKKPINKKCPFCLSLIPFEATKCSGCTADLQRR